MRHLFFSLLLIPILGWGQNSTVFQLWNEAGVSYKVDKKQSLAFDLTTRHAAGGLQTIFPQVSYKYKINKYLRPSIDYRLINDRNQEGNMTLQHRLNANLQFNQEFERLQVGLRLRYQYSTNRLAANFEPEFGQAIRIKPSLAYDLQNTDLEPQVSMEFFTGPMDGQTGYHLNRIRWSAGFAYTFKGPHSLEVAYMYDQRINSPGALNRAILNFSYGYSIGKQKEKAPVKPQRNGRFL
jgi:long-subunit fatty acid transport protein